MIPRHDAASLISSPTSVVVAVHVDPTKSSEDVASESTIASCNKKIYPYPILCPFSPGGGSRLRRRTSPWESCNGSVTSFGSGDTFGSQPKKKEVTFHPKVHVKKFLPDWADPRVQDYETKKQEQQSQAQEGKKDGERNGDVPSRTTTKDSSAELRRLDTCYLRILKKHCKSSYGQKTGSSSAAASSTIHSSSSSFFSEDEWSPRGLEAHFDIHHSERRRRAKLQSSLIILLMQARKESVDEIARFYRSVSIRSHAQAHRQGLWDELEAKHDVGDGVLQALKTFQRAKATHACQWRYAMQELEYVCNRQRNPTRHRPQP